MSGHTPPRWPMWAIIAGGSVAVVGMLIWGGATYDAQGNPLIDTTTASILVAMITAGGVALERTLGKIKHQVTNQHDTNLRDDIDKVKAIAEHAVRAARKASDDAAQTREDVQQVRADLTGQASDIRGIRKDIGRYLKGAAAFVTAGLVALLSFLDGGVTLAEWLQVGIAALAGIGVVIIPNEGSTTVVRNAHVLPGDLTP